MFQKNVGKGRRIIRNAFHLHPLHDGGYADIRGKVTSHENKSTAQCFDYFGDDQKTQSHQL